MRFLVTAGPTREYLDDVRFLTNASSGRMGYAIARAAVRAGHRVHLVSGPVTLADPPGVKLVRVTTTGEMYRAAARLFPLVDCLIGAAAPADFQPLRRVAGKVKKDTASRTLRLRPTTDILAALGKRKGGQVIIAFALEARAPVTNALAKLRRKNADAIVLNKPAALGADRSSVTILFKASDRIEVRATTKARIARVLVSVAESLHEAATSGEPKTHGRQKRKPPLR